jgi:para-nitrobenzyl esterase
MDESVLDDEKDPLRRLDRLVSAEQFVCPSLALADYMATARQATYVYYFTRQRPGKAGMELGAYHGSEIPYIFDRHDEWLPTDETDREITDAMSRYWTAFARTGNPNADDLPRWPAWQPGDQMTLDIGNTVRALAHPEGSLCALRAGATN